MDDYGPGLFSDSPPSWAERLAAAFVFVATGAGVVAAWSSVASVWVAGVFLGGGLAAVGLGVAHLLAAH